MMPRFVSPTELKQAGQRVFVMLLTLAIVGGWVPRGACASGEYRGGGAIADGGHVGHACCATGGGHDGERTTGNPVDDEGDRQRTPCAAPCAGCPAPCCGAALMPGERTRLATDEGDYAVLSPDDRVSPVPILHAIFHPPKAA